MEHPTRAVTHSNGEIIEIDEELAHLMSALWGRGVTTAACCQDVGDGYASITFPTVEHLFSFLAVAVEVPTEEESDLLDQVDDEEYATLPYHLRAASWLVYAPSARGRYSTPGQWDYGLNPDPLKGEERRYTAIATVEFPASDIEAIRGTVDGGEPLVG